jgi:hypothetical protein
VSTLTSRSTRRTGTTKPTCRAFRGCTSCAAGCWAGCRSPGGCPKVPGGRCGASIAPARQRAGAFHHTHPTRWARSRVGARARRRAAARRRRQPRAARR